MRRIQVHTEIDELPVNKKEERSVKGFWLGFIIYTAASTLGASTPGINAIYPAVQGIGLIFLIPAAFSLIKFRIENRYLQFLFYIYLVWSLLVVVRGLPFDFDLVKRMLFDAWFGMFLYFVPLVLLLPKNIYYIRRIFDTILVLSVVFLIYVPLYRGYLLSSDTESVTSLQMVEYFCKNLSLPAGFILLTYSYHNNQRRMLALFVIAVTFLLAIIRARRGLSFMAVSTVVFAFGLYYYSNKRRLLNRLIAICMAAGLVMYGIKVYSAADKNSIFTLISERAEEDTRSGVEEFFYKDMTLKDWIVGRGVLGEYYCPGIDGEGFSNYRDTVETDYLHIILKGGGISLVLALLIALPALFKGLFRSRNLLSKAAGIWILLYLMSLYPANVTTFNMNYILVWISIGICYDPSIRNLPENEMKKILSTRKLVHEQ